MGKQREKFIAKPSIFVCDDKLNWEQWLIKLDEYLNQAGYKKYIEQKFKNEDFVYWKKHYNSEGEKIFLTGVLVYDFRKYGHANASIGAQYECMILCDERIDMSVSKDFNLEEFERMATSFYLAMKEYSTEKKRWTI